MNARTLAEFLEPTLSRAGLTLDEIRDPTTYAERPAWAIFYRGDECKLQICWSARDGGIDFMLAPPHALNIFGLADRSRTWQFMLVLSDAHDELATPSPDADDLVVMSWLQALFEAHFTAARAKLVAGQ